MVIERNDNPSGARLRPCRSSFVVRITKLYDTKLVQGFLNDRNERS